MSGSPRLGSLGLRAQIALALLGVLALAATLALVAIRPLTEASARMTRRRAGIALARAVAGQVALLPANADLRPLMEGSVGVGALAGAAVLDDAGHLLARAGSFSRAIPRPPFEERVEQRPDALTVSVVILGRGAFLAEVSLAPTQSERALPGAVLLYTAAASAAALWVVFVLLTRYTVRPVEALTRAAERVAAGRRDALAEERGAREVVRAARAFNAMTTELAAREHDLSARVEELERATRERRAAQDQLVRTERLAVVGRLSAGIAHEVGNPLAAIVGLTDVLKEGGLPEDEARDFADRIGKEAQRIHRTVRELLDYARAAPAESEAGAAPGVVGNVGDAVLQVARLLAPQKAFRGVPLRHEVAPDLPGVGVATDRLVQVLLNLALNAADAAQTMPGEPGVTLRALTEGPTVVLEVEDCGAGIAPELRRRIFEPFFTTKAAGEGTGLGLAICAVIVELAGGTVCALDRRDGARGARLRVELPALAVRPSAPAGP